jgi:hypothetical protein
LGGYLRKWAWGGDKDEKWVRMVRCGNGKEVKGLKLGTFGLVGIF